MAAAVLAFAVPASAQDAPPPPPRHQGFWIGFGLGAGSDLSEQARDARSGGVGYLRLGGTITPQLLVGGELSGWARRQGDGTVSRSVAVGTVSFYPASQGFFLRSGLGFGALTFLVPGARANVTITEEGLGALFGGGYDVQIGRNLFLTPNLDFLVQVINDDTAVVGLLTIGLTWH